MTETTESPLGLAEAGADAPSGSLLEVTDLGVAFRQHGRWVQVLDTVIE